MKPRILASQIPPRKPTLQDCGFINATQAQALVAAAVAIEGSQKKAAKTFGVSPQYLSDILHGKREISNAVASAFGLRRVVLFEKVKP